MRDVLGIAIVVGYGLWAFRVGYKAGRAMQQAEQLAQVNPWPWHP